jgi:hypothetical protein
VIQKHLGEGHVAFLQIYIGVYLTIYFSFFNTVQGILMKLALALAILPVALLGTMLVYLPFKFKRVRSALLRLINWVTISKD